MQQAEKSRDEAQQLLIEAKIAVQNALDKHHVIMMKWNELNFPFMRTGEEPKGKVKREMNELKPKLAQAVTSVADTSAQVNKAKKEYEKANRYLESLKATRQ